MKTIKYTSTGGGNCTIRHDDTRVVIHWPAGCQDFPDVLPADKLSVAESMVRKLGFERIETD